MERFITDIFPHHVAGWGEDDNRERSHGPSCRRILTASALSIALTLSTRCVSGPEYEVGLRHDHRYLPPLLLPCLAPHYLLTLAPSSQDSLPRPLLSHSSQRCEQLSHIHPSHSTLSISSFHEEDLVCCFLDNQLTLLDHHHPQATFPTAHPPLSTLTGGCEGRATMI